MGSSQDNGNGNGGNGKGKGKARAEGENTQENRAGKDGDHSPEEAGWDDGGARDERLASLDVMGASALEGWVAAIKSDMRAAVDSQTVVAVAVAVAVDGLGWWFASAGLTRT